MDVVSLWNSLGLRVIKRFQSNKLCNVFGLQVFGVVQAGKVSSFYFGSAWNSLIAATCPLKSI